MLSLLMLMLSFYFAFHLVQGDRGVLELSRMQAYEVHLDKELAAIKAQRQAMEEKVSRLRSSSVDVDMLEQQAMFFLGPRSDRQIQMH